MAEKTKILTFAGSAREGSLNKKLAQLGAQLAGKRCTEATYLDIGQHPLPLYDIDYEQNNPFPEGVKHIKELMQNHDGFLIASPEHNSSITATLKNIIDWASRNKDKGTDLSPFTGKVAAIVSTSPGGLGGLRGLVHLRAILSNLGCFVIPNQLAVPSGHQNFAEDGSISNENFQKQFESVIDALVSTSKRFKIDLDNYCQQLQKDFYINV